MSGCGGTPAQPWRRDGRGSVVEATTVMPWGQFGGSWGAVGLVGGALGAIRGGQRTTWRGQMKGHRAIWGFRGPLEGSRDHFPRHATFRFY